MRRKVWLAALLLPWSLAAQVKLFVVQQATEQEVTGSYQVGTILPGDFVDTAFRVQNASPFAVWLQGLSLAGSGFSFATLPTLPIQLAAGGSSYFVVRFQPPDPGAYMAYLNINGLRTTLLGTGTARATLSLLEGTAKRPLANGASVDFGTVLSGAKAVRDFELTNSAGEAVSVQGLTVSGAAFHAAAGLILPSTLEPRASVSFQVSFEPPGAGPWQGTLLADGRRLVLLGTGGGPEPPRPQISVEPPALRGAQQAKVTVRLTPAPGTSATDELLMEFKPSVPGNPDDPAVQFLSTGSRRVSFTVAKGEDVARFGMDADAEFQTGTTAGSILFTAKLGPNVEQFTAIVPSAPVFVDSARSARGPGGVEIQVCGFDTSRSVSVLTFTFFDLNGRVVAPGMMQVDASAAFQEYFAKTGFGSMFKLRASFPVLGDSSLLREVDVRLANSLDTTRTGHIPIQ